MSFWKQKESAYDALFSQSSTRPFSPATLQRARVDGRQVRLLWAPLSMEATDLQTAAGTTGSHALPMFCHIVIIIIIITKPHPTYQEAFDAVFPSACQVCQKKQKRNES